MWVSMRAVVGGVRGRWRVVVEWRGDVRDWRRLSTMELEVVEVAVKLWGDVGGVKEKGRRAAERVACRALRECWREVVWDWCWRCSMTGFSRA